MPLENARQTCRFLLSRIEAQVEELTLEDYPGDHIGPRKWIDIIVGIINTAKSYVDNSEINGISTYKAIEYLRDANELGETAYSYTKIIAGAGPQDLPFPVVRPLQRWYTDAGLKNDILFRSALVANYEIRSIDEDDLTRIRERAPSLDKAMSNIRWPLQCFTVPAKAFGMIPHFAIVAHEIGHAIYHEIGWDFPDLPRLNSELDSRIKTRVGSAALSTTFVIFKRQIYLSWLQEIVSDACGHIIAGPAFFFAVCGYYNHLVADLA